MLSVVRRSEVAMQFLTVRNVPRTGLSSMEASPQAKLQSYAASIVTVTITDTSTAGTSLFRLLEL